MADQVLREHTVQISSVLNLPSLMPYLIQHGCLTVEDMGQFPNTESRRSNNLKFLRMIQERGSSGFNSFLKALDHFTRQATEEEHKGLLDSLKFKSSHKKTGTESQGDLRRGQLFSILIKPLIGYIMPSYNYLTKLFFTDAQRKGSTVSDDEKDMPHTPVVVVTPGQQRLLEVRPFKQRGMSKKETAHFSLS